MEPFDETTLTERARRSLAELRACRNVASVTVVATAELTGDVLAIMVPTSDSGAAVGDWAQPTAAFLFTIPGSRPN